MEVSVPLSQGRHPVKLRETSALILAEPPQLVYLVLTSFSERLLSSFARDLERSFAALGKGRSTIWLNFGGIAAARSSEDLHLRSPDLVANSASLVARAPH